MNEMIFSAATSAITAIITWYAARRKNKAETHISELDAVERAVKVWRELGEGLQQKYEELHVEVERLRNEVRSLRDENKQLKKENYRLLEQIKNINSEKN